MKNIPKIDTVLDPPTRQDSESFDAKADDTMEKLPVWTGEINTVTEAQNILSEEMNDLSVVIQGNADAAGVAESNAIKAAEDSASSANAIIWSKGGDIRPFLKGETLIYSDGVSYRCLIDTLAGESPGTHPAKWLRLGVGVLVSINDTTIGFLADKLLSGFGVDFSVDDEGGDEALTVSVKNDADHRFTNDTAIDKLANIETGAQAHKAPTKAEVESVLTGNDIQSHGHAYLEKVEDDKNPKFGGNVDGAGFKIANSVVGITTAGSTALTQDLDVQSANVLSFTPTADLSVTFSNIPAAGAVVWYVEMKGAGDYTMTWPVPVKWDNAEEPAWATGTATSIAQFYTRDGGTTISGRLLWEVLA